MFINFAFSARKVRGFLKIFHELEGFWSQTLVICVIESQYLHFCISNLLTSSLHFIGFLFLIQVLFDFTWELWQLNDTVVLSLQTCQFKQNGSILAD